VNNSISTKVFKWYTVHIWNIMIMKDLVKNIFNEGMKYHV